MLRPFLALLGLALVSACVAEREAVDSAGAAAAAADPRLPVGAVIGASGFATIMDAPPAPFTPAPPPGEPPPLTPQQIAGHQQFARVGAFQNQVREEVERLDARLRREQAGNYVSLYYDNEGDPSVVFQFLRNGPETLRRYSQHPRFFGRTVRFSQEQLMAAVDYMMRTFAADRVIESAGIGRNEVDVRVNVPEEEFRALMARRGVAIPESVVLHFPVRQPAAAVNAPLEREIARLVRIFPRDDRPAGLLHSINSTAKVVLRDGCFRIVGEREGWVLFPLGARLFVDEAAYLAFGSPDTPGYGRVGETLIFPGSIGQVTAPELVAPIHAACGPGPVFKIHGTASAAAHRAQSAVAADAGALREFRRMYGLSEAGARRALERCRERSGAGFCPTTPPRPVARQSDCPAGTRLSGGLCRTPEGFIRPLPEWLREFADE